MKKAIVFAVSVVFAMMFSIVARADLLTGHVAMTTWSTITNGSAVNSVYVAPMYVTNHTTEQADFLLFCGDFTVSTSTAFNNGAGQEYNAFSLDSPSVSFYSDVQKSRINDLFGYVYSSAFDLDGNILNGTYAQAIQLSIWSILHEETDNYDILDGSFRLTGNYTIDVVNVTNLLLSAVLGDISWSSIGMDEFIDYGLTVYVADGGTNVSQTFISVTGPSSLTPEPATLLIFGLGLAGLGLARRSTKNNTAK